MQLSDAIAVFDKSASRTTPNAQTQAWAVIRAELDRVAGSPVGTWYEPMPAWVAIPDSAKPNVYTTWRDGQRVRLVAEGGGDG